MNHSAKSGTVHPLPNNLLLRLSSQTETHIHVLTNQGLTPEGLRRSKPKCYPLPTTVLDSKRKLSFTSPHLLQLAKGKSRDLSSMIPPTWPKQRSLEQISSADFINIKNAACWLLHSFPSSSQEWHLEVSDPPTFAFTVSALRLCQKSLYPSAEDCLSACLFNLFSEFWLIVPDTGMLKKHNEGLFHWDGPPLSIVSLQFWPKQGTEEPGLWGHQDRHSNPTPHHSGGHCCC